VLTSLREVFTVICKEREGYPNARIDPDSWRREAHVKVLVGELHRMCEDANGYFGWLGVEVEVSLVVEWGKGGG